MNIFDTVCLHTPGCRKSNCIEIYEKMTQTLTGFINKSVNISEFYLTVRSVCQCTSQHIICIFLETRWRLPWQIIIIITRPGSTRGIVGNVMLKRMWQQCSPLLLLFAMWSRHLQLPTEFGGSATSHAHFPCTTAHMIERKRMENCNKKKKRLLYV